MASAFSLFQFNQKFIQHDLANGIARSVSFGDHSHWPITVSRKCSLHDGRTNVDISNAKIFKRHFFHVTRTKRNPPTAFAICIQEISLSFLKLNYVFYRTRFCRKLGNLTCTSPIRSRSTKTVSNKWIASGKSRYT